MKKEQQVNSIGNALLNPVMPTQPMPTAPTPTAPMQKMVAK